MQMSDVSETWNTVDPLSHFQIVRNGAAFKSLNRINTLEMFDIFSSLNVTSGTADYNQDVLLDMRNTMKEQTNQSYLTKCVHLLKKKKNFSCKTQTPRKT